MHDGEFSYTCDICGKKFIKRNHFESHIRTHDTTRPYQCKTCGRRYKEQKHCREHVRKVHPQELSFEALFASITAEDAMPDIGQQSADLTIISKDDNCAVPSNVQS